MKFCLWNLPLYYNEHMSDTDGGGMASNQCTQRSLLMVRVVPGK